MRIVEINQSKQLRHISPTLDGDPAGPTHPDIRTTLSNWLERDKRAFRSATGAGLITYLNTDNRLKLAMSQPVQQNLHKRGAKNVLEALYISGSSSAETVRECIRKIFGIDIFLNPFNLGTLEFKVGEDFSLISNNTQEAFDQLSGYPLLDTQGDGIRSVLGMISAIVSVKKPVILLDEPEAFLHPPQALQLGEMISELVEPSQQIFIATHSADFLRGLLSSTRDAVIIHLDRIADITKANALYLINDFITPELLKYIKDSKFVVADLTHQNNGAYFEEGYAMGLGKPVIQLCKKDVQLHFDIAQKNTIMWETEENIPQKLCNRIKATIE